MQRSIALSQDSARLLVAGHDIATSAGELGAEAGELPHCAGHGNRSGVYHPAKDLPPNLTTAKCLRMEGLFELVCGWGNWFRVQRQNVRSWWLVLVASI